MTMENLVPKEAYIIDFSGYRERLGWVTGIFFGMSMGIVFFILAPSTVGLSRRASISFGAAVLCGIVFGMVFPRRYRRRISSVIDRLYDGDTKIDVPPPPEKELRYRLPCSWVRSKNFAVGGVLYIGPHGLLFVPHKMNLPGDRSVFEMGPNRRLKLSLTAPESSGLSKLLVPRPMSQLQVNWPEGSAKFVIPSPNQVFDLISKCVSGLA